MQIQPVSKTLDQEMLNRYAEASGDHNPIHTDVAFARSTPMGGTIAHGMLVLASISEMMTQAFGIAWLRSGTLNVRFRAPARPGDVITARAEEAASPEGTLKYNVEVINQANETLISGIAEVQAP